VSGPVRRENAEWKVRREGKRCQMDEETRKICVPGEVQNQRAMAFCRFSMPYHTRGLPNLRPCLKHNAITIMSNETLIVLLGDFDIGALSGSPSNLLKTMI
jgi:hypothetical protein